MRREYNYKATETGEEGVGEGNAMGEFQSIKCLAVVVVSFLVVLLAVVISVLADSHHIIEEGSVGIYYKFGALQDEVTHPGKKKVEKRRKKRLHTQESTGRLRLSRQWSKSKFDPGRIPST